MECVGRPLCGFTETTNFDCLGEYFTPFWSDVVGDDGILDLVVGTEVGVIVLSSSGDYVLNQLIILCRPAFRHWISTRRFNSKCATLFCFW